MVFKKENTQKNIADNFFKGMVIVLEGLIGAGKTTLGSSMEEHFIKDGMKAKFFPEYRNDELLNMYLTDMKKYSFHFQIVMIMKRIEIYKEAIKFAAEGGVAIVDRGIFGDMAFSLMQYKKKFFTEEEYKVYFSVIEKEMLNTPHLILYLKTSPEIAFERMQKRNIAGEVGAYTLEYFREVENSHYEVMNNYPDIKVVTIDWNPDLQIERLKLNHDAIRNFLNFIIMKSIDFKSLSASQD
jgi:deoxyadenosine/deoxycytidine kinase